MSRTLKLPDYQVIIPGIYYSVHCQRDRIPLLTVQQGTMLQLEEVTSRIQRLARLAHPSEPTTGKDLNALLCQISADKICDIGLVADWFREGLQRLYAVPSFSDAFTQATEMYAERYSAPRAKVKAWTTNKNESQIREDLKNLGFLWRARYLYPDDNFNRHVQATTIDYNGHEVDRDNPWYQDAVNIRSTLMRTFSDKEKLLKVHNDQEAVQKRQLEQAIVVALGNVNLREDKDI